MFRNVLFLCCAVLFAPGDARAESLLVAVASNFAPTLGQIADLYEIESGKRVTLVSGSTGKHYAQIRNGAPFVAFFAADRRRPELLEEQGYGLPGSRFTYALGRLALAGRSLEDHVPAVAVLTGGRFERLAIANPQLAPYGRAAREVLQDLDLWDPLQTRLVYGENVAQAFQFAYSGNADLGLVSLAQVKAMNGNVVHWVEIPAVHHSPIEQQAIALQRPGDEFLGFVRSEKARSLIRSHGFHLPR